METRSAMAYWQNGKVYLHGSTQSVARTVDPLASWLNIDASNIVLISEYTGGGFGSKGAGAISMAIPALLSKKANAPVMMRITRDDEHGIGRARTGMVGRAKMGFRKDGRITALDLFMVEDNGPYGPMGDHRSGANAASLIWQPLAMRFRGVPVITNTPPRSQQRSPGPMQANAIVDPIVTKAAKQLGLDQIAIRRINSAQRGGDGLGDLRTTLLDLQKENNELRKDFKALEKKLDALTSSPDAKKKATPASKSPKAKSS